MESSSQSKARERKRRWAQKKAEERREAGRPSYTSEWRKKNPEAYEAQKARARSRRALEKTATAE